MPFALFRCDATRTMGGGHVMRSLALARAMERDGWRTAFAVCDGAVDMAPELAEPGREVRAGFDDREREAANLRAAWPSGCDLIVIDHYGWDATIEETLGDFALRRMVIDDLVDRPHACDVLLDQTLGRQPEDYATLLPAHCTVLAGARYAIMRPPFAARRLRQPAASARVSSNRILIAMGLTDPTRTTPVILDGVNATGYGGQVDVVLGPSAASLEDVRARAASDPAVTVHAGLDAAAMANVIAEADLVIGAAGTSSYERACLGAPSLVVEVADNQRDNIAAFTAAGATVALGPARSLTSRSVATAFRALLADDVKLGDMRRSALGLTDGRGAVRAAMALRPEMSKSGLAVGLRPATAADTETLFEWQLQPETRRFARNPEPPTWEGHVAWLVGKLADARCLFNIVVEDGVPVGFVRLDVVPAAAGYAEAFEISIAISSERAGGGLGLAALRLARRLVPDAEIQAVVLPGNAVPLALFKKAGYMPCGENRFVVTPI